MSDEQITRPPREGVRFVQPSNFEIRAGDGEEGSFLEGHFSVFNQWTEIRSALEGHFLERIAPGAFRKAITEARSRIKVLFQHGMDFEIGDRPIAKITDLEEDDTGARYRARLLDGLPQLVLSGLREGEYGASFRFSTPNDPNKDVWEETPEKSAHNPHGLPERTIREAQLFEFGPVTWPAYQGATAGIRSMTDEYVFRRLARQPDHLREMLASLPDRIALTDDGAGEDHSDEASRKVYPSISPDKFLEIFHG